MRKIIAVTLILLILPAAVAKEKVATSPDEIITISESAEPDLLALLEEHSETLEGKKLPGLAGRLFGNERMNIHIRTETGEETVALSTENKRIIGISLFEIVEPTLDVYTDKETIERILVSKDPYKAFKQALSSKDISYEANGIWNKIKFAIVSFMVAFLTPQACGDVTWHVREGQSGDGRIEAPFGTLREAFDDAENSECSSVTLLVHRGTYTEGRLDITRDMVISGFDAELNEDEDRDFVRLKDTEFFVEGNHKLLLEHLSIEGTDRAVGTGIRLWHNLAEATIRDVHFDQATPTAVSQRGGFLVMDGIVILETVSTFEGTGSGIDISGGFASLQSVFSNSNENGGLQVSGEFTRVFVDGFQAAGNSGDAAVHVSSGVLLADGATIRNNDHQGIRADNGAKVHLKDVSVIGTKKIQGAGGININVLDASTELHMENVVSQQAELAGLRINGARVKSSSGKIQDNVIGVSIHNADDALDCLAGMELVENDVGIDTAELPVQRFSDVGSAVVSGCAEVTPECTWC